MPVLSFHLLVLIRIAASVLFGFGIGLERELTNKYAGLRTHILVCLGSCIFTILSIYAFPSAVLGSHGDPARISAQILTGIGFIGGGTVLRHGNSVYGLTTAATLWVAAAVGMACGTGMLDVALYATLVSVCVLVLIRVFEKKVLVSSIKNLRRLKLVVICGKGSAEKIHKFIMEKFEHLHEISKMSENSSFDLTKIIAIVDTNDKNPIQNLYKEFQSIEGIQSISIQEYDE